MKKIFFVGILLVQHLYSISQINVGISAGGVISGTNMPSFDVAGRGTGSQSVTSKSRYGMYGGLVFEKELGRLSFRPQVNFIEKGDLLHFRTIGAVSPGTLNVDYKDKYSFNYLEVPLNIVYNVFATRGKIFVGGGPSFAYALSASHKRPGTSKEKLDFYLDDLNKTDIGLNVIAGYELKEGWFFNVNYLHGFKNIYKEVTTKNRAITFGIGKFIKYHY